MNARRKTVLPLGNAYECTAFPEGSGPRRDPSPSGPGSPGAGWGSQAPVRDAAISAAMPFAVSESGPGSAANTARR
jgi:hypothetical protein